MTDDRDTTTGALAYLRNILVTGIPYGDMRHLPVDVSTLALALAEFDAAQARVSALEAALRAVCEAAVVDYGNGPNGWYAFCQLCTSRCDHATGAITHAPDCPVAAAIALLEPGA